jgi:hypothetical protein
MVPGKFVDDTSWSSFIPSIRSGSVYNRLVLAPDSQRKLAFGTSRSFCLEGRTREG